MFEDVAIDRGAISVVQYVMPCTYLTTLSVCDAVKNKKWTCLTQMMKQQQIIARTALGLGMDEFLMRPVLEELRINSYIILYEALQVPNARLIRDLCRRNTYFDYNRFEKEYMDIKIAEDTTQERLFQLVEQIQPVTCRELLRMLSGGLQSSEEYDEMCNDPELGKQVQTCARWYETYNAIETKEAIDLELYEYLSRCVLRIDERFVQIVPYMMIEKYGHEQCRYFVEHEEASRYAFEETVKDFMKEREENPILYKT
jgi:hypothetical protein